MSAIDELRRGAQRLAPRDGSEFAPMRRDLPQILAQTAALEARAARADGDGSEAEQRARALVFLARRGIDATAMDTDGLLRELDESDEPYYDPYADAPPDDLDGWLQVRASGHCWLAVPVRPCHSPAQSAWPDDER